MGVEVWRLTIGELMEVFDIANNLSTKLILDLKVNLSRELSRAKYDLSISEKMILLCALARMDQSKERA